MKKYLFALGFFALAFASCKKTQDFDPAKQAATDEVAIKNYLSSHSLTAVKDSASALYYHIVAPGAGARPVTSSTITIDYEGHTLDGKTFDQQLDASFLLSRLIEGWQIGIPKIGSGGEIQLYVPSALGYGNSVVGSLPANSVLIFDIKLTRFAN